MSETTTISWANHTGSPWFGCKKVSPGCANCYACEWTCGKFAHIMRRAYQRAGLKDWETGPLWGIAAPRVKSEGFWKDAVTWDRQVVITRQNWVIDGKRGNPQAGEPLWPRAFPSLMDWLDDMPAGIVDMAGNWQRPAQVLAEFLNVIRLTPHLNWLLLTKRLELFEKRVDTAAHSAFKAGGREQGYALHDFLVEWLAGYAPQNVWIGVSVENQDTAIQRIHHLLRTPAAVRWVSAEPLLSPIVIDPLWVGAAGPDTPQVDWWVVGGESGANRRDCGAEAIEDLARQAKRSGVPVWVKQDCALRPGQQGRISDGIWAFKEFPK